MPSRTPVDWGSVVEKIRLGDPEGQRILYDNLLSGARLFLKRHLSTDQDVDDRVHDVFLIVIDTIRRGDLREPERLMGFVHTVLKRGLTAEIGRKVRDRQTFSEQDPDAVPTTSEPNPEQDAITRENIRVMRNLLVKLNPRDIEILSRYYLQEQSEEQIRNEMALSAAQFNLVKSRAKARFAKLVNRRFKLRFFTSR
ncbi:MAG: sigma-70 family RNA polymerase sigma factor [Bryobacteraceae bacterium]